MLCKLIGVVGVAASAVPLAAQVPHDDYYPALAMRMHHEGLVRYHAEYGEDGAVTSCTVIKSSGFPELDDQTCRVLKRQPHVQPQPPGSRDGSFTWSLPK